MIQIIIILILPLFQISADEGGRGEGEADTEYCGPAVQKWA
jgi:hypothetical protein